MDKKQQIEEMATELSRTNEKNSLGLRESEIDLFSSDLYAAGYRKIDGDNYVSREWHDEQVLHLESELERLKSEKENVERNCAVITKDELKEYKRQAVKEFAEKLKSELCDYFDWNEDKDGKIDKGLLLSDVIGVETKDGTAVSLGLIDKLLKEYK